MSLPKADLHMHTIFSDGFIFPDDLAKKIRDLRNITQTDILTNSGLMPVIDFLLTNKEITKIKQFNEQADRSVEVARNIRTVAKLDHNTLLGTEEFIEFMLKHTSGKRVIVGSELTVLEKLPHVGNHAIHSPVYFYDKDGFDMLDRSKADRDKFFSIIARDYLPLINRAAKANNNRFVNDLRKKSNQYFFNGEDRIKQDELIELAKSRIIKQISGDSVLNLSNNPVTIYHTDIADYLSLSGIEGIGAEITEKYFKRQGKLYIPLARNEFSIGLDELLAELRNISNNSDVKVKQGIAHPSTYVRVIARKLMKESNGNVDCFYNRWTEETAKKQTFNIIADLTKKGLIDFIETNYPRYYQEPPSSGNAEAVNKYIKFLEDEAGFVKRQNKFWRESADSLGLQQSGGSDSHFRKGTPNLSYGFCDLDFDDTRVDKLFE